MEELVKNGGMEILVSVEPKKAEQMFNKQQAHAFEQYTQAIEYKKYAIKRRDSKYIAATLKEARPMIEVEQRSLDSDEFLLNTPGFTYDLRKGVRSPMEHNPEDFITKQTAVDPDFEGEDIWQSALDTFFLKDKDLIEWGLNIQTEVDAKKVRPTDREMTTLLFLLRCVQLGLSIRDLDLLTIGMVNDMFSESRNDDYEYDTLATQEDFDKF